MKTIYSTNEWKGYGKEYYHNEYRIEGEKVVKYQCRRAKFFDGAENNTEVDEKVKDSWGIDDEKMPEWLKKICK